MRTQNALAILSGKGWFPVVEFASLSFVIILTYLGIHTAFGKIKPSVKMLISMFLGITAYYLAKLFLVAIFVTPTTHAF